MSSDEINCFMSSFPPEDFHKVPTQRLLWILKNMSDLVYVEPAFCMSGQTYYRLCYVRTSLNEVFPSLLEKKIVTSNLANFERSLKHIGMVVTQTTHGSSPHVEKQWMHFSAVNLFRSLLKTKATFEQFPSRKRSANDVEHDDDASHVKKKQSLTLELHSEAIDFDLSFAFDTNLSANPPSLDLLML